MRTGSEVVFTRGVVSSITQMVRYGLASKRDPFGLELLLRVDSTMMLTAHRRMRICLESIRTLGLLH